MSLVGEVTPQDAWFAPQQQRKARANLSRALGWTPGRIRLATGCHAIGARMRFARMNMLRVIVFACLLVTCALVRLAHAQKVASSDLRDPMIFVVAHGGADTCGTGCSDWIAAEGNFDKGAEARFRSFLASLNGRQLPIVFDSNGGILGQAVLIGRILREHRMTASVGETYPDACRAGIAARPACRKI